MSFLGSMLGSLAGRAALPVMGAASYGAYQSGALDGIDIPGMAKAPSHYEMQARIVDVQEACRLRYRTEGKLRQTEPVDCYRAIEMLKRPQFLGSTIHKSERVTYAYYSMDGQSTLKGTLTSVKDGNGRPYRKKRCHQHSHRCERPVEIRSDLIRCPAEMQGTSSQTNVASVAARTSSSVTSGASSTSFRPPSATSKTPRLVMMRSMTAVPVKGSVHSFSSLLSPCFEV